MSKPTAINILDYAPKELQKAKSPSKSPAKQIARQEPVKHKGNNKQQVEEVQNEIMALIALKQM